MSDKLTSNERTTKALQGERLRLLRSVRDLGSAAERLLPKGNDFFGSFERASLADTAKPWAPKIDELFKGEHGITDADLKLDQAAVQALPDHTPAERDKKEALLLAWRMRALAKEVADKQAAGLWVQRQLFGELLPEDSRPSLGGSSGGLVSVDDLNHLNGQTKSHAVFNSAALTGPITKNPDGSYKLGLGAKPEDIARFVNMLAASNTQQMTLTCENPADLPAYEGMFAAAFKEIMLNGHTTELRVETPQFVSRYTARQGATHTMKNGQLEPEHFAARRDFHKGQQACWSMQAIASNIPNSVAMAANKPARFAGVYLGLSKPEDRQAFIRMMDRDPDLRKELVEMAAYLICTGQAEAFVRLQNELAQTLAPNQLPELDKAVQKAIAQQIAVMPMDQRNKTLDELYDLTKASRHQREYAVTWKAVRPMAVLRQIIAGMDRKQLSEYAQHVAKDPDKEERLGMVLLHGTDEQRKALTTAYLEAVYEAALKKHGITPGVVNQVSVPPVPPATVATMQPESEADRLKKLEAAANDVKEAAEGLLGIARNYAKHVGEPNVAALRTVQATSHQVLGDLAGKRADDRIPGALPPAADRRAYVEAAQTAYQQLPSVQRLLTDEIGFANAPAPKHVRQQP